MRPQFHKQRISDLQIFEKHITTMISLLPKDGGTIDILDWWSRFTLDSSTEYLFGESVDSLINPKVIKLYSHILTPNCRLHLLKHLHTFSKSSHYECEWETYGGCTTRHHSLLH